MKKIILPIGLFILPFFVIGQHISSTQLIDFFQINDDRICNEQFPLQSSEIELMENAYQLWETYSQNKNDLSVLNAKQDTLAKYITTSFYIPKNDTLQLVNDLSIFSEKDVKIDGTISGTSPSIKNPNGQNLIIFSLGTIYINGTIELSDGIGQKRKTSHKVKQNIASSINVNELFYLSNFVLGAIDFPLAKLDGGKGGSLLLVGKKIVINGAIKTGAGGHGWNGGNGGDGGSMMFLSENFEISNKIEKFIAGDGGNGNVGLSIGLPGCDNGGDGGNGGNSIFLTCTNGTDGANGADNIGTGNVVGGNGGNGSNASEGPCHGGNGGNGGNGISSNGYARGGTAGHAGSGGSGDAFQSISSGNGGHGGNGGSGYGGNGTNNTGQHGGYGLGKDGGKGGSGGVGWNGALGGDGGNGGNGGDGEGGNGGTAGSVGGNGGYGKAGDGGSGGSAGQSITGSPHPYTGESGTGGDGGDGTGGDGGDGIECGEDGGIGGIGTGGNGGADGTPSSGSGSGGIGINGSNGENGMTCSTGNIYYSDTDGDGYGNHDDCICASSPPPGYVDNNLDCNDSDPNDVDVVINDNPISPGSYFANASITSAGKASSSGIINTVEFQAGESIYLTIGFIAETGSDFHALIGHCNASPTSARYEVEANSNLASIPWQTTIKENLNERTSTKIFIYPNPASPNRSINVRFELLEKSIINLEVYDPMGKLVKVLADHQFIEKGEHQFSFTMENLPNNIYTIILRSEKQFSVNRFLLINEK